MRFRLTPTAKPDWKNRSVRATAFLLAFALATATLHAQASPEEQAAQRQALGFLGYLDGGRFADSYAYTGSLMRSQLDREAYAAKVQSSRASVGTLQGRELIDAIPTQTVPGAPDGQYIVLHYHANFSNFSDAVETITLAFSKGYWRIVGYYIK
jgi:hypothetical protein